MAGSWRRLRSRRRCGRWLRGRRSCRRRSGGCRGARWRGRLSCGTPRVRASTGRSCVSGCTLWSWRSSTTARPTSTRGSSRSGAVWTNPTRPPSRSCGAAWRRRATRTGSCRAGRSKRRSSCGHSWGPWRWRMRRSAPHCRTRLRSTRRPRSQPPRRCRQSPSACLARRSMRWCTWSSTYPRTRTQSTCKSASSPSCSSCANPARMGARSQLCASCTQGTSTPRPARPCIFSKGLRATFARRRALRWGTMCSALASEASRPCPGRYHLCAPAPLTS
mmetsp:Transcript_28011/g.62028  ORF Transcript_28011/g.62028 Transcript_28011/m.62028 type:complete len:276 (+) Transcript_28011:1881-2708(+)